MHVEPHCCATGDGRVVRVHPQNSEFASIQNLPSYAAGSAQGRAGCVAAPASLLTLWLVVWKCTRLHGAAGELREQVRSAFERARGQRDPYAIKYTLSDGRTQLKQLNDMLALRR